MKNVIIRDLTESQVDLIEQVKGLTEEKTASKAIMSALADYVKLKGFIEEYKASEIRRYTNAFSKIMLAARQIEKSSSQIGFEMRSLSIKPSSSLVDCFQLEPEPDPDVPQIKPWVDPHDFQEPDFDEYE